MRKAPASITFDIEPGLEAKYTQPILHPGVFERLIKSGLITEGGELDGEPTYDTTDHFAFVMILLDYCQTEVRRSRKRR